MVAEGSGPVGEIARLAALRRSTEGEIVLRVRDAVDAGHTWTEVAAALGVSRQSAHERYAPRILDLARAEGLQPVWRPSGREDTADTTASQGEGQMDALDVLIADHNRVRGLFTRAKEAQDKHDLTTLQTLATEIFEELEVHTTIEEEIFYPWAHDLSEEVGEMIDEGVEEHHVVKILMQEAGQLPPEDDQWTAKITVIMEGVEHHAEEEESDMFPPIRGASTADDRRRVGEQMEARKAALGAPVLADKIDMPTDELRRLASEQAIPGRSTMDHEELAATVSP